MFALVLIREFKCRRRAYWPALTTLISDFSAGLILVIYFFFYASLAAVITLCMYTLFLTISPYMPTFTERVKPPGECPEAQKPSCQGFLLLLPKLLTQVDQLHPSIWSVSHELSHVGNLLRIPSLGHKLLMLHFLLYNKPHCQVTTHSLIMFISTILPSLTASLSEMLGSSGPQGSCSNASVRCSSSIQVSLHIAHQHGIT